MHDPSHGFRMPVKSRVGKKKKRMSGIKKGVHGKNGRLVRLLKRNAGYTA
jgi:hypothetical protein